MTAGEQQLVSYLGEIIRRTDNGDIKWTQPSPTTFVWSKEDGGVEYVTSIQRTGSPPLQGLAGLSVAGTIVGGYSYLFQVSKRPLGARPSVILSFNSQEKPILRAPLEKLYGLAASQIDLQAASVLKTLLGAS